MIKYFFFSFLVNTLMISYGYSDVLKAKAEFVLHTNELSIKSNELSKEIYKKLKVRSVGADLYYGLFFKNDEFFFCENNNNKEFKCFIYLSANDPGSVSSYYSDSDYGKGSMTEFIETKPIIEPLSLIIDGNNITIKFKGQMAQRLYKKFKKFNEDIDSSNGVDYKIQSGEHLNCYQAKIKKKIKHFCELKFSAYFSDEKSDIKSKVKSQQTITP